MTTNTTKEVRAQKLEKAGTFKTGILLTVLYRRFAVELWASAFWIVLAIEIWDKLGK